MAFTHYRTRGFFLKNEARGEADEIFTLFTSDFGRIRVLGRAIRKITSKLRSGAGLFYYSEIEFIQGKQYKTLTDAVLIDKFDVDYMVADTVDSLTAREQRDDKIWDLLIQTLQVGVGLPLTTDYFLWRLFDVLGYSPQLYSCACCEKKLLPERLFFAPDDGGVVCQQCFQKKSPEDNFGCEILVDTVKMLRLFLKEPIHIVSKLKIGEAEQKNIQDVSELYLNFLKQANNPQS